MKQQSQRLASTILEANNAINTDKDLSPSSQYSICFNLVETTKQKKEVDRQIELIEIALRQVENGLLEEEKEEKEEKEVLPTACSVDFCPDNKNGQCTSSPQECPE